MFGFWEGQEEMPPLPARSTVFVMRNGRYEPQNLMPVLPRSEVLDFDGFVARRGASAGYMNARPPEIRQASLVKNPVSIRRDSAKATSVRREEAAPEQTGPEEYRPGKGSGSSVALSFTFDALKPGTLTLHLLVSEVEHSPGAAEATAAAGGTAGETFMELVPRGSAAAAATASSTGEQGGLLPAGAAESLLPPPPPGRRALPARAPALALGRYEPGLGQLYESPPVDLGSLTAEELAFDPARPKDIPIAIRLEPDLAEGDEPCAHYAYFSLHKVKSSGGGADETETSTGAEGGSTEDPPEPLPQWTAQIFAQKAQYGSQSFVLHDVFGVSSRQAPDAEPEGGSSDCVICLSEPRDTAVLPCRHMCFCSYCAGIVRLQCDRCPVCRQKVVSLLQFKRDKEPSALHGPEQELLESKGSAAEPPRRPSLIPSEAGGASDGSAAAAAVGSPRRHSGGSGSGSALLEGAAGLGFGADFAAPGASSSASSGRV